MTSKTSERPLDHATERIVKEMAAVLLPELRETVALELAKTVKTLPVNVDDGVKEAVASLSRLRAVCEDMAKTMQELSDNLHPLVGLGERLTAFADRQDKTAGGGKIEELVRSFETALPDWEGILKANGRAHTKELSDFAAEVSELLGDIRSNLPVLAAEAVEKALASRAGEWADAAGEHALALEARLTKLEKMAVAGGGLFLTFCAMIAATLFFK